VPHGLPHGDRTANGVNSSRTASANGTGSPGATHAVTTNGTRSRWTAGPSRSRVKRAIRRTT
jgi:hypothetical protein